LADAVLSCKLKRTEQKGAHKYELKICILCNNVMEMSGAADKQAFCCIQTAAETVHDVLKTQLKYRMIQIK